MVAPGAGPRSVATVPLAPGQILVVPPSERMAMEDAPPDAVDRALRRPRGPPTREWCQANSPGSRHDVSMCEACRSKHKRCLTSRLWKARCVAREQGWDLAWVWAQMGEKTEVRLGEPPQAGPGVSLSAPVVSMGPHVDKGKRKVAPLSGPIRQIHRRASPARSIAEAGPSGSHVFSPLSGHPLPAIGVPQARFEKVQVEAARWRLEAEELRWERAWGYALVQEREEELGWVRHERDEVGCAHNLLLRERDESWKRRGVQGDEVERLQVQLACVVGLGEAAGPVVITAAEIDALAQGLREAHELEGRRREWLLRKVAGACNDALTWAQEHCLLLNGLSSGVSYVVEEAASAALPLELAQGVACLGQLMAVHRHRNLLDSGSWLEAFVDGLQDSPSEEEIMEIVQEAMTAEFGLGRNGAQSLGVGAKGPVDGARGPVGGAQGPGGRAA
ncbi:hypothetical protein C0992_005006 [Termitomyces sp. T32_za158]|nr:hypothetical protein C0992_005006 [Termitomyces sp. T32_za158]